MIKKPGNIRFLLHIYLKTYLGHDGIFVNEEEYSEFVRTEIVVNAATHRSYLQTGAHSQVDIYNDRIVITNPGGMFDGSEVQLLDIRHVPSKLRNPILADVFGRMRLMERKGKWI